MSIELRQAAQQALKALEAISNEMTVGERCTNAGQYLLDALGPLRTAIQQADAQQPATAIACGIPGMAKTACPYCEQGFAFEYDQPATGEPVGYMNEGHIHELAMGRIPYGYVYPEAGAGASTAVYTHPAPSVPDDDFDLICNAIDKADTITMEGDYMLDSDDCTAVVRVMQVLLSVRAAMLAAKDSK